MKYFFTYARFLAILFLGSAISSCSLIDQSDKIIGPNWEPSFAVPVLNTEFSMSDVLTKLDSNSFVQTDAEGLLSIVYEDQFTTTNAGPLFDLPDVLVPMFDTTQSVGFPIEGITALEIKQGLLNYSFESVDIGLHELIVQIPEALRNGVPYEKVVSFTAPGTFAGSLDLSSYELDLEGGNMTFKYFARPVGTNQKNPLLNYFFEISGLEYRQIDGFFGSKDLEVGADSIDLELFADMGDGEFRFNDPRISINIANTYGVPIEVKTNSFSVKTENGRIDLDHTGLENGITLNYPGTDQVGTAASTSIEINKDNSNLPDLLASKPLGLTYDLGATLHPAGDSTKMGFALDDSGFEVGLKIEIPLDLQLNDLSFEQDLGVEMEQVDQIESAVLTLITDNGFPLELVMQAYFLDAQGAVQDSLFDGPSQLLAAAAVDQNGKVNASTPSTIDIELTPQRWYYLQNSKEIRVKAKIASTQQGNVPVKFYDTYTLSVKMGILANLNP